MSDPESEGMSLVVPFIACRSQGGPYDDEAFVAGFQCGEIDKVLATIRAATAVGAPIQQVSLGWTVRTDLVRQLELIAMNRGFPFMEAVAVEGMPEWSAVAFATQGGGTDHDH